MAITSPQQVLVPSAVALFALLFAGVVAGVDGPPPESAPAPEPPTLRTEEVTPTRDLAWLVGFVECGDDVAFFALNVEGENVREDWPPQQRTDLVLRLLEQLGIVVPQTT